MNLNKIKFNQQLLAFRTVAVKMSNYRNFPHHLNLQKVYEKGSLLYLRLQGKKVLISKKMNS